MKQIKLMPLNKYDYIVLEDYKVKLLGNTIVVPKDFVTDGNSTLICRFNPMYITAAVIHDYLYSSGIVKRALADRIYLEALKQLDVPWLLRYTFFAGVRLFGWNAWREWRKVDNNKRF